MAVDVRDLPFPINVTSVKVLDGHRLALVLRVGPDGERRSGVFDMSAYLDWPVFRPLADDGEFAKAYTDGYTVCWPQDIDISPERLYTDMVPEA